MASVGASIGFGNIWRFPYLTYKHGGWVFMIAYAIALALIGVPMLVLELTLGQKMQRGSAAALRGISPRLAGVGWAASVTGFISCLVYNILLGTSMIYLVYSGSQPWKEENLKRPEGCSTSIPPSEVYLYRDVAKVYDEEKCTPYQYGETENVFNGGLFLAVAIAWVLCAACLAC